MTILRKKIFNLFAISLLAVAGLAPHNAAAATVQIINLSAPSFVGRNKSYHNDGLAPDACAAQVPLTIGDENRGDLQNATGSFIATVILPQGATVTRFTLFANDNDGEIDSAAYLMRKRIFDNLVPAKSGILTMAVAKTSGAVLDTLRAFTDTTIILPVVGNRTNQYFVELINCGTTVEPFSVQIEISVP